MGKDGGRGRTKQSISDRRHSMYGGRTIRMQFSEPAGRTGERDEASREEVGCDRSGSSSFREGLRSLF